MRSKSTEKVVSTKFSSKLILQRNGWQTSKRSKSKEKKNSQSAIKQKKKLIAKDELVRIESSLKKEQIDNKSWQDNFVSIAAIKAASFNTLSH